MRVYSFSLTRSVACLAIVLLHTVESARLLYQEGLTPLQGTASQTVVAEVMWAVPLFLMVTGALLLDPDREVSIRKVWTKYIPRVAEALVVFALLFRAFDFVMNGDTGVWRILTEGLKNALLGTGWAHLWYLYVLLGLYVLMPFGQMIVRGSTVKQIQYLLLVAFLFLTGVPVLEAIGIHFPVTFPVATIYPLYLFLGWAIHSGAAKPGRKYAALVFAVTTALIAIVSILERTNDMPELAVFRGYSSPLVVLQSAALFALLDNIRNPAAENLWNKAVRSFDRCSFGIYLIHMIFVRLVLRYGALNPYQSAAIPVFLGLWFLFVLASYLCTFALQRVPGFRKFL